MLASTQRYQDSFARVARVDMKVLVQIAHSIMVVLPVPEANGRQRTRLVHFVQKEDTLSPLTKRAKAAHLVFTKRKVE